MENDPSRGHSRIYLMALMMTLLLDDHDLVAVSAMSTISAITVQLSACAVALLMTTVTLLMAALDHDGLGAGDRWRGDYYKSCDHQTKLLHSIPPLLGGS